VERVDARAGWGQPLELRATVEEDQKFVPQPTPAPVPFPQPVPFPGQQVPFPGQQVPFPGQQVPFPGQPGFPQPVPQGWPGQGAQWRELPGAGVCMGVDAWGNIICCNKEGKIYEKKLQAPDWSLLGGICTHIARGHDGTTWCVNREQQIFRREADWVKQPGSAVFVTVGQHDQVVVLDQAGFIFKWDPNTKNWLQIDGRGSTASIGFDGTLVVCDNQGETYRRDGMTWTKLPIKGHLPAVVAWNSMYMATKEGEVVHSWDGGMQWRPIGFNLLHISAVRGHVVGTSAQQKMFHLMHQ